MKTFRYLDFSVYKDSKIYYRKCLSITENFPRKYWELKDQLIRAALSVSLNIAEGSAKYSDKDFKRYLENSLGSINECFACIDIAFENELITNDDFSNLKILSESITKQLGGLVRKLRNSK